VRQRFGSAVKDISFDRAYMLFPALSLQNYRNHIERTAGPMLKLVEMRFGRSELSQISPNALRPV